MNRLMKPGARERETLLNSGLLSALGVESVLAGLRDSVADDDQLLERACAVFDGLLASFRSNGSTA